MSINAMDPSCARAVIDLLDEAPYLPADFVQELLIYRGEPGRPADTGKLESACRQLISFAPDLPDSLESELYAYAETLGIAEAVPE